MNRSTRLALLVVLGEACTPLGNLDAAGSGRAAGGSVENAAGATDSSEPATVGGAVGSVGGMSNAARAGSGGEPGAGAPNAVAGDGPGPVVYGGSAGLPPDDPGTTYDAGAAGQANGAGDILKDLPNVLANSPVKGSVTCVEASFLEQPTFEVRTPTATFIVRRELGDIISIVTRISSGQAEWVGYNDYRPRRSVGVVNDQGQHLAVTTQLDTSSVTAGHVRVRSESPAGDWQWAWDFYPTQATLTISRSAGRFAFLYRGTPGGKLDDADRIGLASGEHWSAEESFLEPFPDAGSWLYFADPALKQALFLIEHRGNSLPNRFDTVDGDSARLLFGDGQINQVPNRFSVGVVDYTDLIAVATRALFVIAAVQ